MKKILFIAFIAFISGISSVKASYFSGDDFLYLNSTAAFSVTPTLLPGDDVKSYHWDYDQTKLLVSSGGALGDDYVVLRALSDPPESQSTYVSVLIQYTSGYSEVFGKEIIIKGKNSLSISGPQAVYIGQEATFTAKNGSLNTLNWSWDPTYADLTSSPPSTNSNTIKLKFQKIGKTSIHLTGYSTYGDDVAYLTVNIIKPPYVVSPVKKENVCLNSTVSYKIDNLKEYQSLQWVPVENCNLVSTEGFQAQFKATGNGYMRVKAIVKEKGQSISNEFENSDIWVGVPTAPTQIIGLESEVTFNPSSTYTFKSVGSIGATEYEWVVTGGTILMEKNKQIVTVKMDALGPKVKFKPFEITLYAKNKCGRSLPIIRSGGISSGGDIYEPYLLRSSEIGSEFTPKSIKVYNLSGAMVHSQDNISGDFDIKTTTLPDGIYIIEKSDGKERQSEKVILKR